MAQNEQNTPWWQVALGVIAVGAGAVAINAIADKEIEQYENASDNDIIAWIIGYSTTLEDSFWDLYLSKIGRSYNLRRFHSLATSCRTMHIWIENIVTNIHTVETRLVDIVTNLDTGSNELFYNMLKLKAHNDHNVAYILKVYNRITPISNEVSQLLSMELQTAQNTLDDLLYGLNNSDRLLFISLLQYHANTNPTLSFRTLAGRSMRLHHQITG